MLLKKARDLTAEKWGKAVAQKLFYDNPRKMVMGESIEVEEPRGPVERKSFIRKVFGLK
jgi:hypothetical protein